MLQFDLSGLPAGITSSQISKATVTLFVNRVNTAGSINVAQVSSAWSEAVVTNGTLPSLGTSFGTFNVSASGQYITVDATALVQSWVNGTVNNGIALTSSAQTSSSTARKMTRPATPPG